MNKSAILFLLFAMQCIFSHEITHFLNTDCNHNQSCFSFSDVNFLVRVNPHSDCSEILKNFNKYGINLNIYDKFTHIDAELLRQFCSVEFSPYDVAKILSHLSIYKYCLEKNIKTAYIIEESAVVAQDPIILTSLFRKLNNRKLWELFYTDKDLHDEATGNYICPSSDSHILKRCCNNFIDKVFFRYGTTSYFISYNGMKKALKFYRSLETMMPIDQMLISIPYFRKYSPRFDIVTNRYSTITMSNNVNSDPVFKSETSEWIDPTILLTPDRFDVIPKYVYAKYHIGNYCTDWHKELYKAHLSSWVRFYNSDPLKVGYNDFEASFVKTINSILTNQFDSSFSVPVNNSGKLMNGSHRTGICLALDLPIHINVIDGYESPMMTSESFKNKYCLNEIYLDFMALEYHLRKNNTYVICVDNRSVSKVNKYLSNHAKVVYTKSIKLSDKALKNLSFQLNDKEVLNLSNSVTFILFEKGSDFNFNMLPTTSKSCICSESAIINRMLATTAFSRNSICFLETAIINPNNLFHKMLDSYISYMQDKKMNIEHFCIDSGGVLAALGLRDTQDIDLLHIDSLPEDWGQNNIDSHNQESSLHSCTLDDIVLNPKNYFYYRGVKFVEPRLVKKMKINRNSSKDKADVKLLETYMNI